MEAVPLLSRRSSWVSHPHFLFLASKLVLQIFLVLWIICVKRLREFMMIEFSNDKLELSSYSLAMEKCSSNRIVTASC
jgi:hypothetical protein